MTRTALLLVLLLSGCSRADQAAAPAAAANEQTDPPAPTDSPATGRAQADSPATGPVPAEAEPAKASPCLTQGSVILPANAIRAVGTEPFWGARVEGRCVTYSTPEDQAGTRVWTQFAGTAENGRWAGSLDGKPFVMTTRPQPGCSDGMSDKRYPIAVALVVRGERRTGCAEPL